MRTRKPAHSRFRGWVMKDGSTYQREALTTPNQRPPNQRPPDLRAALEEAARDAHALTVRWLGDGGGTCVGPFETCPSMYCSKYRAALEAETEEERRESAEPGVLWGSPYYCWRHHRYCQNPVGPHRNASMTMEETNG